MPGVQRSLTDQIRKAIDDSGLSRYRICKDIELSEASMSRFMAGKGGLSLEMLDKLGRVLGLAVVVKRPTGNGKGKVKP